VVQPHRRARGGAGRASRRRRAHARSASALRSDGENSTSGSPKRAARDDPETPAGPYLLPASFFRFT
jgi:hypothetical protein